MPNWLRGSTWKTPSNIASTGWKWISRKSRPKAARLSGNNPSLIASLRNKTVIVTGASSGIGLACAREFSRQGASVVLAARSAEKLQEASESLSGEHLTVICDVSKEEDCRRLVEASVKRFGGIDILIVNAGLSMRALFRDCKQEVLERLMQVNFWGAVFCTRYALPYLLQSKGSLVAMSTTAGLIGLPGRTGYSASKFALHGFFDTLRAEHYYDGLHVCLCFPGFVASNIRKSALKADGSSQNESPRNEGSMMQPEEVAIAMVKGVLKRKRMVIPDLQGRLVWWMRALFPRFVDRIVANRMSRELNSPFTKGR